MNPTITHEVSKAVRDSGLALTEKEFDSVVTAAIDVGAERISSAETGKLLIAGYPYLTVELIIEDSRSMVSNQPLPGAGIVRFTSRIADTPVTHWAAFYNGSIFQTNTVLSDDSNINAFVEVMHSKCDSPESFNAVANLLRRPTQNYTGKVDLTVPEGMMDLVLEGRGTATKAVQEHNFPVMMELVKRDRKRLDIINGCSSACDGVMGDYERRLIRLSNEMPMLMQEAKSYALNAVQELLKPFRERLNTAMPSWGTW